MESFNDNSNIERYAPFDQILPRYNHMNMDQMKSYFIWRTKVRNKIVEPISISYVHVYIYELLHLVGVGSAEIGFSKLVFLWENAVIFAPGISESLARWMIDFVEYYNLPINYLEHPMLKSHIESDADKLVKALSMRDYSVINDIIARKGYNYKGGAFSRNVDGTTLERLITNLLQNILETNDFISYNLFGICTKYSFVSAVFEPYRSKYSLVEKSVNYLNYQYIIELARTIEIALDEIFEIPQKLMNRPLYHLKKKDAAFIKRELKRDVIKNKISFLPKIIPAKKKYSSPRNINSLVNESEVMLTPRIVEINISSLSEIRDKTDLIAEKLISKDLLNEYKKEPKKELIINHDVYTNDKEKEKDEWTIFFNSLDAHGKKMLSLIAGQSSYKDISGYAVGNHLMVEEEIEKINNLAIETIGDTIIKGNGTELLIYEEYITNIDKKLN
ncbi:MAG: TerB N-terminal domain-containing protein [Chromatiaceae bacterium]|nr:TerB N-terminal domain-containing protein [Chromatiaceae bacterium]